MKRDPVLVVGGAGYVGSHVALALAEDGYPVVVLDNLSTGQRTAIADDIAFVEGDAGDFDAVTRLITEHRIAAVVHLAGSISVPESMRDPLLYYRNNSGASTTLISACVEGGVTQFVFSSTAAVYGIPSVVPVAEDAPTVPISPYGHSKLITEWALRDAAAAHDFHYTALRYFNVAGSAPKGRSGRSAGYTGHLMTVACQAAIGLRGHVALFGTDYDTKDGTCVRDYIHVADLADAHVAALRDLEQNGGTNIFNCGYGNGFSVREVLEAVSAEAGTRLDIREEPRRTGDPPVLVADASRLRVALDWAPRYGDLAAIVRTALSWEEKLARGENPTRAGDRRNLSAADGSVLLASRHGGLEERPAT